MTVKDCISEIEKIAPLRYQEPYDNAGLIIGNPNDKVTNILITLDVTEAVLQEAISCKADLIISHHPLIFKGIKKINGNSETERCIQLAIKNNIAIYACHTNIDSVNTGVNAKICEKLGITNTAILKPTENETVGEGMIGELPEAMDTKEFLQRIKQTFGCGVIRHTAIIRNTVKRIAVCGGSGSFLIEDAIQNKADMFITADVKYHDFFLAENKVIIADIGHFESEQFTKELFYEILKKKFYTFAIQISKVSTNPINYL